MTYTRKGKCGQCGECCKDSPLPRDLVMRMVEDYNTGKIALPAWLVQKAQEVQTQLDWWKNNAESTGIRYFGGVFNENGECIFLQKGSGKTDEQCKNICSIYSMRPQVCADVPPLTCTDEEYVERWSKWLEQYPNCGYSYGKV